MNIQFIFNHFLFFKTLIICIIAQSKSIKLTIRYIIIKISLTAKKQQIAKSLVLWR